MKRGFNPTLTSTGFVEQFNKLTSIELIGVQYPTLMVTKSDGESGKIGEYQTAVHKKRIRCAWRSVPIQQGIIARLSMLRSNKTRVFKFNLRFRRRNQGSNERQILRHLFDGSILHSVYV